jgi:hypothetical protein
LEQNEGLRSRFHPSAPRVEVERIHPQRSMIPLRTGFRRKGLARGEFRLKTIQPDSV